MSTLFTPTLEDQPRAQDVAAVRDGLEAYNRHYAPDGGYEPLVIIVRAADQSVAGGLVGGTYWGWLHIDMLWLKDEARGQGLGTRTVAMAEQEALRRGCRRAHLDTMDFQALPFYQRLGYRVWGVLEDLPPGHQRYFLKKDLQAAAGEAASPAIGSLKS
jgi:GNAT superfamily N-acetyltransferase